MQLLRSFERGPRPGDLLFPDTTSVVRTRVVSKILLRIGKSWPFLEV
jgi:hypothetical protein